MDSFWKGFSCVRKLSLAHRCRTTIQEESISSLEGTLSGLRVRAAGAEEIVRSRRSIGPLWAAPERHRQMALQVALTGARRPCYCFE